ncbi:MAG: DUF3095 family protein [Proteobacteria bacterium]|nr:DUF3095 family protein [Pseudomonadota bacterium]
MQFELIANGSSCRLIPETSHVVVADVRGSTKLISDGKQRDVNLVGAACIAAIRNVFPKGKVPYVFGGDGATFLVEKEDLENCLDALSRVQHMAMRNLKISLRVGSISVAELRQNKTEVRCGQLPAGSHEVLYYFRGDGISLADTLVKQRDRHTGDSVERGNEVAPIEGLSCRLLPFESQRGSVVSFVIEPKVVMSEQDSLFELILAKLANGGDIGRYCPVQAGKVRHKWLAPAWTIEALLNRPDSRFGTKIKFLLEYLKRSIFTKWVFAFDRFNNTTGLPSRYINELPQQTDWFKANGSLYLILDMTTEEHELFGSFLADLEKEGQIQFGSHVSKAAVITCHLHPSSQHSHFHFVDGLAGGLTAAAVQLKAKKSKQATGGS